MDATNSVRKIHWDSATHMIFIECCIQEVENGNMPGTHFNKIGWKNLLSNFNSLSKKNCNKLQLKNHWDAMRKDLKLWNKLMSESGIGWDPIKKTIDASPEWWDEKIRVNPELAKFKDKNLEIYKMYYDPLFKNSVATGERAMTPNQRMPNIDDLGEGGDLVSVDTQLESSAEEGESEELMEQNVSTIQFPEPILKRTMSQPFASQGKKRKISVAANLRDKIDMVFEILSKKSMASSTVQEQKDNPYSMEKCVEKLSQLTDVEEGGDFWCAACDVFESPIGRRMFCLQPNVETQMRWLKWKVSAKIGAKRN